MASSLVPGCLAISDLLTIRERGVLFTLLEPHWKLIKTTVAQVLEAKRSEQSQSPGWSCLGCGALCLIEDESICSYFLRLFCVKRAKLLWEQEVYIPFKYRATRTFFHTFPADGYQVGFNFANETEAEEFYLAVEAVQRNQEKTISTMEITNAEEDNSASDPPDSGIKPPDHLDEEQHFPEDAPFTADTRATTLFRDLDPTMRKLLTQARLTEEDLKDKDIAEAVDCIINQFGGIKAVQRELRSRNPVSQTLPRTAGASISLALRKGPLPPVPSIKNCTTSQRTPQDTGTADPLPTWVPPPPPSHTPPAVPERFRKCASFKHMGSSKAAGRGDDILIALREVFKQKELLQQSQGADGRQGQ